MLVMTMPIVDDAMSCVAQGVIDLPGSKSLSNRILLLSALAQGTTTVENLLESEVGRRG
jgi:3-phosphoshikimate 1-carboxyvinyltransferase